MYLGAKQHIVCALHAKHEAVVLVADLVSVAAKPASAPDLVLLQPGQGIYKNALPTYTGSRVAVFQPPAGITDVGAIAWTGKMQLHQHDV